jgi:predicted enzyme related to lactoylglutathione lyase
MNRFCHYELRTTDVDAARAFYSDLLGTRFREDSISVGELPAQAAARGAPPHWLGYIRVDDVVGTMLRFVRSGATRLGPAARTGKDAGVILRDPFGAIVALTSASPVPRADRVVWHLLSARDEALAFAMYAELFGWTSLQALDLGPERGRHVTFTWDGTTEAVGSTSNVARLPHVHPQWLFFFPTENLDESLARVRTSGGLTLPVVVTAEGNLVAPCDDPQGAAFGLYQNIVR